MDCSHHAPKHGQAGKSGLQEAWGKEERLLLLEFLREDPRLLTGAPEMQGEC